MSSRTVIPSVFNLSHILPLFYIYGRQASWFYLPVSISFFPVFSNGLCEQNSKSIFGKVTNSYHTKQLSSESDYTTIAEAQLSQNDILVVKSRWLSGKPIGLRIIDKADQTQYAIVENDTGYLNLFFSPNGQKESYTVNIQEKNLNENGFSGIYVINIHFDY